MNYDGALYAAVYAILRTDLGVEMDQAERVAMKIARRLSDFSDARNAVSLKGYAVHHINGDPHDHRLENLALVKVKP